MLQIIQAVGIRPRLFFCVNSGDTDPVSGIEIALS
jgi:hypothetical protein